MKLTYKFEEPRTKANHGQIFLGGEVLFNFWNNPWGADPSTINLNRDGLAIKLDLPIQDQRHPTINDALEWIQTQLQQKNILTELEL